MGIPNTHRQLTNDDDLADVLERHAADLEDNPDDPNYVLLSAQALRNIARDVRLPRPLPAA